MASSPEAHRRGIPDKSEAWRTSTENCIKHFGIEVGLAEHSSLSETPKLVFHYTAEDMET